MRLGGARGREMVQGQGRQPNAGGSDRAWGSGGGARVSVAGGWWGQTIRGMRLDWNWRSGKESGKFFMWGPLVSRSLLCGTHLSVGGREFCVGPHFSVGERERRR